MTEGNLQSCICKKCAGACQYNPGWFHPDEIKPLADKMGVTEKQLFDKYLRVDFYESLSDDGDVFVLAPSVVGHATGDMAEPDPRGTCVFFDDGKCGIHEQGKPRECQLYLHGMTGDEVSHNHRAMAEAWNEPERQEYINALLGRKAAKPDYDPFELLINSMMKVGA